MDSQAKWGSALRRKELQRLITKINAVGFLSHLEYGRMMRYARTAKVDLVEAIKTGRV